MITYVQQKRFSFSISVFIHNAIVTYNVLTVCCVFVAAFDIFDCKQHSKTFYRPHTPASVLCSALL